MGAMTKTPLASLPMYLDARVWRHPSIINNTLEVLKSPNQDWSDPECEPILDYLATACTQETECRTVIDPGWMGGEYERSEYTVYESCPGDGVKHKCSYAREASR